MTPTWIVMLAIFNSAVTLLLTFAVIFLYRQWGALVLQGSEGIVAHHGLRLGTPAPRVAGRDAASGATVGYEPRKEVLAFASSGCEICEERGYLFRDLAVVQDSWRVTYVQAGEALDDVPPQLREFLHDGRLRIVLDPEQDTHKAFDVHVSPFVMAIDEQGRVAAKNLVSGLSELLQILIDAGDESLIETRDQIAAGQLIVDLDSSGSLVARHVHVAREVSR